MADLRLAGRGASNCLKALIQPPSLHYSTTNITLRMQPLHEHIVVTSLTLSNVSPLDTIAQFPLKDTCPSRNHPASSSRTPMHSVTAEDVFTLLDKINAEMTEELALVTTAIGEVKDSINLLRSDRMKACVQTAKPFTEDEERNNLQIL